MRVMTEMVFVERVGFKTNRAHLAGVPLLAKILVNYVQERRGVWKQVWLKQFPDLYSSVGSNVQIDVQAAVKGVDVGILTH